MSASPPMLPKSLRSLLLPLCVLALNACSSFAADRAVGTSDVGLITDAMRQIEKSYVAPVTRDRLVDGALKGMLNRLDPHSDYMDETEFRELMTTTSGQFGGVGIEISVEEGVPPGITAIDGTPAAAAGLQPGDRIVKSHGPPTVGTDLTPGARRPRRALLNPLLP